MKAFNTKPLNSNLNTMDKNVFKNLIKETMINKNMDNQVVNTNNQSNTPKRKLNIVKPQKTALKDEIKNTIKEKFNGKVNNGISKMKNINFLQILKSIISFLIKKPLLTGSLIVAIITVSNIGFINQTFLLKNIDSLKASIVSIQTEQHQKNVSYDNKLSELKKQIEKIELEKAEYNESQNIKIAKKTELLKANINKLNLLTVK